MSNHALDAESYAKGLSASTYTDRSNTELLALYDIRVAIGDPEGKLEVAEVVERVRAMAEALQELYDFAAPTHGSDTERSHKAFISAALILKDLP